MKGVREEEEEGGGQGGPRFKWFEGTKSGPNRTAGRSDLSEKGWVGEQDGQIWGAGRSDLREMRGGRGRGGGFSLQGHALARYSRSLRHESTASLGISSFLSSAG